VDISASRIEKYTASRLALGKARATVNRELQPLKQAFTLAVRQGRLTKAPYVPLLREDNAREGFFEQEEFAAVLAHLPKPIDDIARFAYLSGWRKGEILSLRWSAVDRKGREVRLRTSKSGHGRVLPLEGELWNIIKRRWAAREFRRPDGMSAIAEYVFHRRGKPIGEFRKTWATACKTAEVPEKLFHDLRRTAVRNMVRAGVPQSVAMAISGHRTISMFLRYNITSDEDRRKAIRKIQANLH
jgi:integrase